MAEVRQIMAVGEHHVNLNSHSTSCAGKYEEYEPQAMVQQQKVYLFGEFAHQLNNLASVKMYRSWLPPATDVFPQLANVCYT